MEPKTVEEAARERFAREEEERRNTRLLDLEAEEIQRREAEARERAAEEKRATARVEADELALERQEWVRQIEASAARLALQCAEYVSLDARHRTALRDAGVVVSHGSTKSDLGNFLAAALGDFVARNNQHRDPGAPSLSSRDSLCPKD